MSVHGDNDLVEPLGTGTRVEVRNRFDGTWSAGFEVDGTSGRGYWLRRLTDATVLPTVFLPDDVRCEGPSSIEVDLTSTRSRTMPAGRSVPTR